jgi:hypothetical protein
MRCPAIVTMFVVKTGLCVASGIVAASFFAGAFVSAGGEFVFAESAARVQTAEATSKIQIVFFMRMDVGVMWFKLGGR